MPRQKELAKGRLNDIIRQIKVASLDRVAQYKTATENKMKKLKVKRNIKKAVVGIPVGSDQVNMRTFVDWLDTVKVGDKVSIRQIVAIDATAQARFE